MRAQGVLTQLTPWKATTHLNQCLVFQRDLTIVADFPECGSKAPLVSSHTQVLGVFNTLGSDPWDSFYALWTKTRQISRSVSGVARGVNHCHHSRNCELTKKLF